jgi:hypothetical protein
MGTHEYPLLKIDLGLIKFTPFLIHQKVAWRKNYALDEALWFYTKYLQNLQPHQHTYNHIYINIHAKIHNPIILEMFMSLTILCNLRGLKFQNWIEIINGF